MKLRIRERCNITAMGGKLYSFINSIRQSDIICTQQHCKGDIFYCRIFKSDLQRLQKLAGACGVTVESQPCRTVLGRIRPYRLRLGLAAGLLLCIGIIFWYSNTVSVIEIKGNTVVSDSVILAVLERGGLTRGTWIPEIDYNESERKLRLQVPDIAWAAIRHTGSRIVVEISEITPKTEMLNERTPCNIVSMYDAQITDVRVYNGHLERLIGDGVSKGEMLVSGVFEDDKGHVSYHHAIAFITGIYSKEAELSEYFNISETKRTGKTVVKRYFRLFSLKIPLNIAHHDFEEFSESETDTAFSFLNHTLPFGIVRHTYAETKTETAARTEEETKLALNGAIVRYEKNFLSDKEILDRDITYSESPEGLTCHINYTLKGEIGRISDIFVK